MLIRTESHRLCLSLILICNVPLVEEPRPNTEQGDKPGFTTTSRLRPQFFSYSLVRQGGIFYHFYLSFDSLSISSKRIEAIFRTKYHLELRPLIFLLNILPDLTCCKYMIWNIVIISFFFALSVEFSVWCQFSVVSQLNFCSIVGSLQRSEQDKCSSLVEILLSVRAGWLMFIFLFFFTDRRPSFITL